MPLGRILPPRGIPSLVRNTATSHSTAISGANDSNNNNLDEALDTLSSALRRSERGKVLVITGAGISTDSGVPDYRGPRGTYTLRPGHRPITFAELMQSHKTRQRYWSRSYFGLTQITANPNSAHYSIAKLQEKGYLREDWLITQNVDSLHLRARLETLYGISDINFQPKDTLDAAIQEYSRIRSFFGPKSLAGGHELELHGSLREVICMGCGDLFDGGRFSYQFLLTALNEGLWGKDLQDLRNKIIDNEGGFTTNADGDAESESLSKGIQFNYPLCNKCCPESSFKKDHSIDGSIREPLIGSIPQDHDTLYPIHMAGKGYMYRGIYKPSVVFFGENLHQTNRDRSLDLASKADLVLVFGTSVQTYSAYRILLAAKSRGVPIYMINNGPTRADEVVTGKWDLGLSDVLPALVKSL